MSSASMSRGPRLFGGKKEIGLSLEHQDEEDSATSEPERLCVGVIMKEPGPIVVVGEMAYIGKEADGVIDSIDCLDAMFISSI